MRALHLSSFGGGVILAGAPDTQRLDEVLEADSYDIGPRGALIAASELSTYLDLTTLAAFPLETMLGIFPINDTGGARAIAVGACDVGFGVQVGAVVFDRSSGLAPGSAAVIDNPDLTGLYLSGLGPLLATVANWPGLFTFDNGSGVNITAPIFFLNLGAREGYTPKTAVPVFNGPGLYVVFTDPTVPVFFAVPIMQYDSLGTGPASTDHPAGTQSKPLLFRGIIAYNNHLFGWGYDAAQYATTGDGPNRVMYCNVGNPLKWGNDNQLAVGVDRPFTDSDAIFIGTSGEVIRGAIVWAGKLWFGTNQGLHYIAGYGRNSYSTDGANPVQRAFNIVGPTALVEGPDKLLYGVSDQGLWGFDGINFEPHFRRLVDKDGNSNGWWDLIWTDPTRANADHPRKTNADLVWMAVDWDREQVLIGIPYCDATAGSGYGQDTVVVRFHVRGGGFTRQVFTGRHLTAAGYFRREGTQPATKFLGDEDPNTGIVTVSRYGYRTGPTDPADMPLILPRVKVGPYAAFGPDGEGVVRRAYLTVSWADADSLPIVFLFTTAIDQADTDSFRLYLQPTAPIGPAAGDLWLDTSQTDTSIGNATATSTVPAHGGYLLKTWTGSTWASVPGQGAKGTRALIPIPLSRRKGTRQEFRLVCEQAGGRFQVEGFGLQPGSGEEAA